jgi:hypothetical protein
MYMYNNSARTHTLRYAAALPKKIWLLIVLISDFNKELTSSLRMIQKMDRNMLESFICFNTTILDYYIIIYS